MTKTMIAKYNAILARSQYLRLAHLFNTFYQLACWLNAQGFLTEDGKPFKGGRGVASLVHKCHLYHAKNGNKADADLVSGSFTKANGDYAFK